MRSTLNTPLLTTIVALSAAVAATLPADGSEPSANVIDAPNLIVRQCYAERREDVRSGYGAMQNAGPGAAKGLGTRGTGAGGGGVTVSSASGRGGASRKSKSASPVMAGEASADADDAAPPSMPAAEPAPAPVVTATMEESEAPPSDGLTLKDLRERTQQQAGPRIDWGGNIFLSNDDAMSLASAQRLLYALDRNVGFTTDQIRPHELLNYFTFDTQAPSGRDTFGVHTSAEVIDGDTLSLALTLQAASPPRQALDLTLLVDRSGSMSAEGRMDYTKRALQHAADNLQVGDRVDLVLFDHTPCTPVENFVVGRDDPSVLYRELQRIQPRGSTDLDRGLKEAYRVAADHTSLRGRSGRVMVFTDALLNTGDVNPHTVTEVGKALEQHDIRLTGVGVGRDFRDDVLNRLTEKGQGAYVFLGSERVVDRLFDQGFDALVQTVAHDVHYELDLPPSLGMERFYGEEASTVKADVQPVNVQAGTSQVFLQDLAIKDGRIARGETIALDITWEDPLTGQAQRQRFTTTVGQALSGDPHNSRKARSLMSWTDALYAHAMGGQACGEPLTDYRRAIGGLQGDAEIAYVSELLGRWCGEVTPMVSWTEPAFLKVRLDADQAIGAVDLDCGTRSASHTLTASDQIARFEAQPGTCQLTLHGAVPMTTTVQVPSTGADLRCVVRGGRMSCG